MENVKIENLKVLLAIPVYNEQRYINDVLDEVAQYIDNVLVIDDGSTDRSADILNSRSDISFISHAKNRGYGQSMIDAFKFANDNGYDWVITMDCDLQHEPVRIPDFLYQIQQNKVDIVSGSRYLDDANECEVPEDRKAINKQITEVLNQKLNLALTDAFCGFKAYRTAAVAQLPLTEQGYAFPLQFWAFMTCLGLEMTEIPVSLIYNDPNRSFGGTLDDKRTRLEYYMQVLTLAMAECQALKSESCCCKSRG